MENDTNNIVNITLQKIKQAKENLDTGNFYDREDYHRDCDNIILDFLKEIKYNKIADEYEKAQHLFWYA